MATLLFSTALIILALTTILLLNRLLNNLALNHWHLTSQGSPYAFSNNKELAIVTGGSSGFGKLIALGLAPHAKVIVLDITDLPTELLSSPNISFRKCDLTSPQDVQDVAVAIKEAHGTPSILINNAGIATSHTILDTSDEWLEKIFRVNIMSHFALIREFLPGMLAMKKGHVVTVASMAAYASTANLVDYSTTKSAALALHNGLTQELRHRYQNGHCIRTSVFCPMWARTPLIKTWESSLNTHRAPVLEPSDVANAVVRQVLAAKSGTVYLPWHIASAAGMAAWPLWLQGFALDLQQQLTVKGTQPGM